MNDILFGNNNKRSIRRITKRELTADKKRNFFLIAAILLTTFMLTSVFSIGISYYDTINMNEKRMQGSISQMAFAAPSDEQIAKIDTLDYVKTVGIGAAVGHTNTVPGFNDMPITYVDQTQWEEMFCPTYSNIIGHYPENENEIILSRYILDAMGIENAKIGMTIPISYVVDGTTGAITKDFVLSCIYTEYIHSRPNSDIEILCSKEFAQLHGALINENLIVNVIFKDSRNMDDKIEKLKTDLPFYENQPYVQSPAFDDNYGSVTTYLALGLLVLFLMFVGYLLIYNVMYISVSRDIRFLGMLKTIGVTPKQIRHIVIGQVLYLCVIGLPLGSLAAALVSLLIVPAILSNSSTIDTGTIVSFSPIIYIGANVFSLLTAFLGAITPARRAAAISPIEALHYSGEHSSKLKIRYPVKGKPIRMAIRNIFRDRKSAAIVMLSLFLSITVFTSIMTVVTSIDIDNYIDSEYDYDFFCISDMTNSYFLNDHFIEQVQKLTGKQEEAITKISSVELLYNDTLEEYLNWYVRNGESSADEIIVDNAFMNVHTIKGIDPLEFDKINEMLPTSIDKESFERGEIAIINVINQDLERCFDGVSSLRVKREPEDESTEFTVGGTVYLPTTQVSVSFGYSMIEILVSNSFLQQYIPQLETLSFGFNVEDGYDEQIYNELKEFTSENSVLMASRYEGKQSMQDAKTIMFILGGGISFILGFIGVFNFVNVMSVGVMVRRQEFATLESIGMSKKQLRSMLRSEGLGYAVITLLSALTIGNLIGYCIFKLFKSVTVYAKLNYPVIPVLIVYAVILLICFITPEIAYRNISKDTLVERLRQAE